MGTATKHPVPDWDKPSFVIFDTERQSARVSKITNDGLTQSGISCCTAAVHMTTVGVKGLTSALSFQ